MNGVWRVPVGVLLIAAALAAVWLLCLSVTP